MLEIKEFPQQQHADLQKPEYVAWRQFLQQSDGWSADRIANYQLQELQRVIRHAYQYTRGYRALYDQAGVHPNKLHTLEDLRRFPFVHKESIRDNLEDYSAEVPDRSYISTGGSTPLSHHQGRCKR